MVVTYKIKHRGNKMNKIGFIVLLIIFCLSPFANATLVDNGDGTITQYRNDGSVLMWLKNADVWNSYWDEAVVWADGLSYAGYDDWRLPNSSTDKGYNIISPDSEMSYMFYVELGNKGYCDADGNCPQPGWGLINTGLFDNLQPSYYWSGTEVGYDPTQAMTFLFNVGLQGDNGKQGQGGYAWAVRTVVPEPISSILFITGGGLLAGRRLIRRQV